MLQLVTAAASSIPVVICGILSDILGLGPTLLLVSAVVAITIYQLARYYTAHNG
jgi:hypothetical protein